MVKLTEDFIFRLKSMCSITAIVASYLELKVSSGNSKCCCPFHSEKTPSFVVFEGTQSFYCFGCGTGGDVITFIEKIENIGYLEAVSVLAKRVGLDLPKDEFEDDTLKEKITILEINKEAARFYHSNLLKNLQGKLALNYLTSNRGITKKTIVRFGLGFSLDGWNSLLKHLSFQGYSVNQMEAAGLVVKSKRGTYYDRFRNRIMFPIIDLKGDVVGFGARLISKNDLTDQKFTPKYINSSDNLVFKKSFGLFGLNFAKNSCESYFLLCEGYMDVIMLHQNGFNNAVASLGTSLTKAQARLISRHNKEIILAYDMDNAGKLATNRAVKIFEEIGVKTKILKFKGVKDPDEYIKKYGCLYFKNIVKEAKTAERIKLDNLTQKYDLGDVEQKNLYINEYCLFLVGLKDPIKKEIYLSELCNKLKLDRFVISNHIKYMEIYRKKVNQKNLEKKINFSTLNKLKNKEHVTIGVTKAQEGVLRFLYYNPDKLSYVKDNIKDIHFNLAEYKRIYNSLISVISCKKNLDFATFRHVLKEKEMSMFCKIVNDLEFSKNTLEEFNDYVKLLKNYYELSNENVVNMSVEKLEKMRKRKAAIKL